MAAEGKRPKRDNQNQLRSHMPDGGELSLNNYYGKVGAFRPVLQFSPPIKLIHDITEILLKVA